ncbi:MAG: HAMP domain-containing sensor histidine kinase [Caldimonas sp.]
MMHNFLANNRANLIARCKAKVASRLERVATEDQLKNGIPMFLDQLTRTLQAEQGGESEASVKISGRSVGTTVERSEMAISATAYGKEMLTLGYTVDQVVHDYGDLCQSITDLAYERDAPFAVDEFRTLNRCLDNAVADAVTEFSFAKEAALTRRQTLDANERLGSLAHELRNALNISNLAFHALEAGTLPVAGATGAVLKRSLTSLGGLIDRALGEIRDTVGGGPRHLIFSLAVFIAEAKAGADLAARAQGCTLVAVEVDPLLGIYADRDLIMAALSNLLHNAFKFTHPLTQVTLNAYALQERILIDVSDHCGGLPATMTSTAFAPFARRGSDRSGLGLGLSIARQGVESQGGTLSARDVPGTGCVFTINLPRYHLH